MHHVGPVEQIGGGSLEADLALLHEVGAGGDLQGEVHGLLDQDDRGAGLSQLADDLEELGDERWCQSEAELIDEEQPGTRNEGHGQREHLLLTAGEVSGGRVESGGEVREVGERGIARGAGRGGVVATGPAGEAEMLGDRQ